MINIGNNSIENILVGDTQVDRVYLGVDIVWEHRDYSLEYFTIESLEDENDISIKNVSCGIYPTLYYSIDNGQTWSSITFERNKTKSVATINSGETIIFKCTITAMAISYNQYNCFSCSKDYNAYGNVMSLIWGDDFVSNSEFPSGSSRNITSLFREDAYLIDASNLVIPASTMPSNCCNSMFRDCVNLTKAPKLPATTLNAECYSSMFEGCIGLLEAPELPALMLDISCYNKMFCMSRTSKLTTPKMTKSPILASRNGQTSCYAGMFQGNGNLTEVTCLLNPDSNKTADWLTNCSTTGVFKKRAEYTWPVGTSGIPSGWTVVDAND